MLKYSAIIGTVLAGVITAGALEIPDEVKHFSREIRKRLPGAAKYEPAADGTCTIRDENGKIVGTLYLERISDHAVNLVESAEEMHSKDIEFTGSAKQELSVIIPAVSEILDMTLEAFEKDSVSLALEVEPLEQVIDYLKEKLRTGHILRLQQGECSSVAGFIWSDILTNLERTGDHCSNIAGCIIDMSHYEMHLHESQREFRNTSEDYRQNYLRYMNKYSLPAPKAGS